MRRVAFVAAVLLGCAGIVLGAARGLSYEPPNVKADGPQESTADLVQASVRGCVEALGLATVGVEDGVAVVKCRPNLGTLPVTK